MREFNESLHSSGVNSQAETLTNVHPGCSLASPFIIHELLKFLVKLIYGNKLVKHLHWGHK